MNGRSFQTLYEIVDGFSERGDQAALRYFNGYRIFRYSFRQLHDWALRFAAFAAEQGVEPGGRILIWGPNSPAWAAACCGSVIGGYVLVPIDARHQAGFIRYVADETGAQLLLRSQLNPDPGVTAKTIILEELTGLLEDTPPHSGPLHAKTDDIAQILYTSGTTGSPKGVVLTQGNQAANVSDVLAHIPVDESYHALSVLPMSHALEQTAGFWTVLAAGGSVTYIKALKPSALSQTFQRTPITAMVLVPRLLELLMERIQRQAAESGKEGYLRFGQRHASAWPRWLRKLYFRPIHKRFNLNFHAFVSGGSSLPEPVERFWLNLGFEIWQGYGLTECGPVLTAAQPGKRKIGSVGLNLPHVELRLGEGNEIQARGPNIFQGYYQRPDDSRDSFIDGWFRSGDVGEIDDDGFLFIRGRLKDIIVTADGINVYPDDIESVLNRIEGVRESCVLGVGEHDEIVHAVLLLDNEGVNPDQCVKQANSQLPAEQRVESVSVWPEAEFPKTPTLKIKKREVRKHIGDAEDEPTQSHSAAESPLFRIVAEIGGLQPAEVSFESTLGNDLGLSSIDRVELAARLEGEFRTDIDETALTPETTVQELDELIQARRGASALPFRRWTRRPLVQAVRRVWEEAVVRPAMWAYCDVRLHGLENLEGLEGPVMFTPNHTSHVDTAILKLLTPPRLGRRICPAAWYEYFEMEGFPWYVKLWKWIAWQVATIGFNIFPFPQTAAVRQSMAYAGELVDEGWSILIFPEGARTMDGSLLPFQRGTGLMAHNLQIPLVPVAIVGGHSILPAGAPWPRRGRVDVWFGEPFHPSNLSPLEIHDKMVEEVKRLWAACVNERGGV